MSTPHLAENQRIADALELVAELYDAQNGDAFRVRAYREGARRDALPKIAPRRFNPERKAWLPILHLERDGLHYTALFSNTALAHKLGTTHDWVVVFYENSQGEGQCTVVTERRGPLTGKRVVRGREAECELFHRAHSATGAA